MAKTFQCVAHSGNTGKEIVIMVSAVNSGDAERYALEQARQQFGSGSGAVTIRSIKEV